ncbi:MAG: hypothetical protein CR966_00935 [Pseudomonadales bacterium]|nr:MAG: hypothetical protein CR966_00935 [Pseudomonadales bacterium]
MSVIYTRTDPNVVESAFGKNIEDFREWLQSLDAVSTGYGYDSYDRLMDFLAESDDYPSNKDLCQFVEIQPRSLSHGDISCGIFDSEQVEEMAEILTSANLSVDDEFFDDFEDYCEIMQELRDLFVSANKEGQVVLVYAVI